MNKTDYELIELSIGGDTLAFEELLSRYKNLVYSVVLRMVNDSEDANDLAQEVFVKVYRNLGKYSPEFKFSTWVIRISTNTVIDFRRKKKPETVDIDDFAYDMSNGQTPENICVESEGKSELSNMINQLPDMYKIPIVLYHLESLSYQEISDITNTSLSKVKNRIFRGRKILKDMILEDRKKRG